MPFDRAGLMVYDTVADSLKIAGSHGTAPGSLFHVGAQFDPKQTLHGLILRQQRFVIRKDISVEGEFAIEQATVAEGLRSYCGVPIIVYGASIGVVALLSYRKEQYSEQHAEFLQELANQIALALNSMTPHCATHPASRLICPRCIGSSGGLNTAAKYRNQLADWGSKGGRGKRKSST